METPRASLPLSVLVINALEDRDIILLEHLAAQTYESLMAVPNLGEKTLEELRAAFTALGLPSPAWKRPRSAKSRSRRK